MRQVATIGIMVLSYYFLGPGGAKLTGMYLNMGVAIATAVGSYAISTLFPIKATPSQINGQELSISTASMGMCIPVVFGKAKVTPNAMNYDEQYLRSVEIRQSGGKGGGGSQVVGHNYYLSYEMLMCMGEIDSIQQVYTSPGSDPLLTAPIVNDGSADYTEFEVTHDESKGGTCRFYWGNENQTRDIMGDPYASTLMNYRNYCWALMGTQDPVTLDGGWGLGQNKYTTSYAWILQRLPKDCAGIVVRGSNDTSHPHYNSANPCAVLYEALTNTVWGAGIDPAKIDVGSFERNSWYYAENNIGLNFVLTDFSTFKDLLTAVQTHCKCQILLENGQIKFVNLLYDKQNLASVPQLTEDECLDFDFNVPTYASAKNRCVADYTEPVQTWKNAQVDVRNDANIALVGEERTMKINLSMFIASDVVKAHAERLLIENSKPSAVLRVTVNRRWSKLQFGDLICLRWSAYAESGKAVLIAFRVANKKEAGSDGESIVLELSEALEYPRQVIDVADPVPELSGSGSWGKTAGVGNPNKWNGGAGALVAFDPIQAFEVPALLATKLDAVNDYIMLLGQRQQYALSMDYYYSLDGTTYNRLGGTNSQAYSGITTASYPAPVGQVDRKTEIHFILSDYETLLLGEYNKVKYDYDNLEQLLIKNCDYMIVGEEIMQVGSIEHVSGSTYKAKNLIRGQFGTKINDIASGALIWFVPQLPQPVIANAVASGSKVWLRGYPSDLTKVEVVGTDVFLDTEDYGDKKIGLSTLPLPPVVKSLNVVTGTATVELRPRMLTSGAGIGSLEASLNAIVTSLDHDLIVAEYNGSTRVSLQVLSGTWDGEKYTASYPKTSGATHARFYSQKAGKTSALYATEAY